MPWYDMYVIFTTTTS